MKNTIPAEALIITDDSTRNVLEYYLAGREESQVTPLSEGFIEYQIGDYRVVTIPEFHFYLYDFKADWDSFQQALGEEATKPLWVCYIGFKKPLNAPQRLFRSFPPHRILEKANYQDNHLLQLELKPPEQHLKADQNSS